MINVLFLKKHIGQLFYFYYVYFIPMIFLINGCHGKLIDNQIGCCHKYGFGNFMIPCCHKYYPTYENKCIQNNLLGGNQKWYNMSCDKLLTT